MCDQETRVEDRSKTAEDCRTGTPGGYSVSVIETDVLPFPGITAAGRWTDESHQSLLSRCHHRASAESSGNPLTCPPGHEIRASVKGGLASLGLPAPRPQEGAGPTPGRCPITQAPERPGGSPVREARPWTRGVSPPQYPLKHKKLQSPQ